LWLPGAQIAEIHSCTIEFRIRHSRHNSETRTKHRLLCILNDDDAE
jgi:hypothetical protein